MDVTLLELSFPGAAFNAPFAGAAADEAPEAAASAAGDEPPPGPGPLVALLVLLGLALLARYLRSRRSGPRSDDTAA